MSSFANKTIYQIYPKSFQDTNHDGHGDIPGIIKRLDYLADLGVDYLWITPFFLSPQRDNGYDIADYRKIDPRYGTMEDFEQLIKEADGRGIHIMLDMVLNHTSTEHIWFQNAVAGDRTYQDYYIFKDGDQSTPPTNWQSKFGGSAWEYQEDVKKWYLHLFDVSQADLNWDNPKVREELKDIILFWKAKGVKGFRFDVINLVSKPEIFEDDFIGDGRRFYTDGPHIHEYLKELVKDTGIADCVTVGEMSSTSLEHCVRYANPDEKELRMCFSFHHLKIDYDHGQKWKLKAPDYLALKELFRHWGEGMQAGNAWNALFWCNHDQPRIVSRLGSEGKYFKESAKMLAAMIHLMRGTPYVYQGEEIGMTNAHFDDITLYKDVESLNYYQILREEGLSNPEALQILGERSRDNSRTPMQWSSGDYAGFSDTKPWLSFPENHKSIYVDAQISDEDSILSFYKRLIRLRKEEIVISEGTMHFLESSIDTVLLYERNHEERKLIVYCNMAGDSVTLPLHPLLTAQDVKHHRLIGNYEQASTQDDSLNLRPYECLAILKLND